MLRGKRVTSPANVEYRIPTLYNEEEIIVKESERSIQKVSVKSFYETLMHIYSLFYQKI